MEENWAICQPPVHHASLILGLFSVLSLYFYVYIHTCRAPQRQWPWHRDKSLWSWLIFWGWEQCLRLDKTHIFNHCEIVLCTPAHWVHPQQSVCNSLGGLCLFAVQSCLDVFRSFCGSHISLKNNKTTEVFLLLKPWVSLFSLHHLTKPTNALVQSAYFPPNKVLPPTLCKERQMAEGREQSRSFWSEELFQEAVLQ